jgi:hypothetical protein
VSVACSAADATAALAMTRFEENRTPTGLDGNLTFCRALAFD